MAAKTANRVASSTSSGAPSKKVKMTKATNLQGKSAHPKTADMVNAAIKELAERSGSSLTAIKKFIGEKYDLDSDKKISNLIKKYLRGAVANGSLVQTKGKGANGSFKMPSAAALAAKRREAKALKEASKKIKSKKPAVAKKSKITASEKASITKKQPTSTKIPVKPSTANKKPKSTATKAVSKSPKAKKNTKPPTSKPDGPRTGRRY